MKVSSEAPRFKTVEANPDLTVIHLPSSPPVLVLTTKPFSDGRYRVGDLFMINCTSPPSKPPAKLRYFINNKMVKNVFTRTNKIMLYNCRMTGPRLKCTTL